ncbi:MAG: hypothetical protein ABSD56_05315 [Bryobacteraceae bacterium]
MRANAFRDRVLGAKEALSGTLLSPPSPDSRQLNVLGLIQEQVLRHLECSWATREGGLRGLVPFDAIRQNAPPVVHAVGIGRKIKAGEPTDTPAVRVYVTRKAAVPRSERIPRTVNGVPTDVIEAPPACFLAASCTQNRTAAVRPLIGGVSTSHVSGATGTIGYFCRSTRAQDSASDVFVLSNAHIYANCGAAETGDALIQPGSADGGSIAHHVAAYHRAVSLIFGGAPNEVDAAIGRLIPGVVYSASICSIGPVNGAVHGAEDDEVVKHGRTTGYTEGVIEDELIDFIMLPGKSSSYVKFRDQMRIVPAGPAGSVIAASGDSGSLVVKKGGHEAVGLLHSAAIDGSYAYASHVDKVLSQLKIGLL